MDSLTSRRFSVTASARVAQWAALGTSFLLSFACPAPAQATHETQFSLGAKAVLERHFAGKDISYLLMDASGSVVAERWSSQRPISPGSLVKPFLAVAYGEQHGNHFPTVRCLGTSTRCWLPAGHMGRLIWRMRLRNPAIHTFLSSQQDWTASVRNRPLPAMDSLGLRQTPALRALWDWAPPGKKRPWR